MLGPYFYRNRCKKCHLRKHLRSSNSWNFLATRKKSSLWERASAFSKSYYNFIVLVIKIFMLDGFISKKLLTLFFLCYVMLGFFHHQTSVQTEGKKPRCLKKPQIPFVTGSKTIPGIRTPHGTPKLLLRILRDSRLCRYVIKIRPHRHKC